MEDFSLREDSAAWPIAPTFFVRSIIAKNEKYSINKHGVYSSDTIRGLLADASDDRNIQNPLALFQVVEESCEFAPFPYINKIEPAEDDFYLNDILKGKKVIRVDPQFLYKNKTCCEKFRECKGCEKKCHEQDCRIALLYHKDLTGIHYSDDLEHYYRKLNEIIDEYNREIEEEYRLHCERDKINKGLYVWYRCRYSNFFEYFFPIAHSGRVIAVLMQGQRIPKTLTENDIFKDFRNDPRIDSKDKENLSKSIQNIRSEFGEDPMPENRLNAIWERIRTLEERVDEKVMDHSRAYIHSNFHRIEQQFHHQIQNEIKKTGELTDDTYKKIVNEALRKICYVFNKKGFIRIYSTELKFEEENSKTDTFYLIGSSSKLTEAEKRAWDKIEFYGLPSDLNKLGEMKNGDFNIHLIQNIEFTSDEIFRIESLSIGNTKHLIWKKYPKKKNINRTQFDEFSNFLITFYHILWEPYNLLRSVKLRKNLETSMRVSVHETSQIIPVIISTLQKEYYLDSRILIQEDRSQSIKITHRENSLYDTIQRLLLLDNLYKRSTMMFKKLKPQTEWTDLHRLIYAARSLCDEKAKENNLQKIVVKAINDFKFSQYEVYTDYQLISHALFSLIDNAIKYGYMGSVININISLSETDSRYERNGDLDLIKSIQISIVSYGTEIKKEEEKRLYELFYRSPASKTQDGMGIGLFLVKKICSSLGYTIEYKGCKLSEYNLPVYDQGRRQGKKIATTVSPTVIKEAVNEELSKNNNWYIEDLEFDAAINQPTYRNEFIVTLNKIDNNLINRKKL